MLIATNNNHVTSRTIIDHIITNMDVSKTKSGVLHYDLSDHLPIFSIFNFLLESELPFLILSFCPKDFTESYNEDLFITSCPVF